MLLEVKEFLDAIPAEVRKLKGRKALEALAIVLHNMPPIIYDHSEWFHIGDDNHKSANLDDFQICGTAACANGWAAAIFDKYGCCDNGFSRSPGYSEASEFFNITYSQSHDLFSIESYSFPTPEKVATRIEQLLERISNAA